jgi:hypothetical protein
MLSGVARVFVSCPESTTLKGKYEIFIAVEAPLDNISATDIMGVS